MSAEQLFRDLKATCLYMHFILRASDSIVLCHAIVGAILSLVPQRNVQLDIYSPILLALDIGTP